MENSIPEKIGKVYLIRNPENDFCYVGSTICSLKYRLSKHSSDYKRWKNWLSSFYTVFKIFETYALDNIKIEVVESDIEKSELFQREKIYIQSLNTCNKLNGKKTFLFFVKKIK